MKLKCFAFIILSVLCISLFACQITPPVDDESSADQKEIYSLAVASGYSGTYEQWLASIRGEDGKTTELRAEDGYIQWKYTSDSDNNWRNLISIKSFAGEKGEDGKKIVLRTENGYIEWSYEGDTVWTKLVNLNNLKGDDGEDHPTENDTYTVNYVLLGGSMPEGYQTSIEVNHGECIIDMPIPTRKNFIFTGWYTGYSQNDGQCTVVTPILKDTTLYAFWQEDVPDYDINNLINNVTVLDEYELLTSEQHGTRIINAYKLGQRTNLPLFWTYATPPLYPAFTYTLSMDNTYVTEEAITRGLETAHTKQTSIEGGGSIELEFDFIKLGGNASTARIRSDTTTTVSTWAQSVAESRGFSFSAVLSPANAKIGHSYRLDVTVNVIYYAYFIHDSLTGEVTSFVTAEFERDSKGDIIYRFLLEESDENGLFSQDKNILESIDISSIDNERLTRDGLYREHMIPEKMFNAKDNFENAVLTNNNGITADSAVSYEINFKEYFGYDIEQLKEITRSTGAEFTLQMYLDYYVSSEETNALFYDCEIQNKSNNNPLYCFSEKFEVPILAKYHAQRISFATPLPIEDFEDTFYVIFTLFSRDSMMRLQIGSIGLELCMSLDDSAKLTSSDSLVAKATQITAPFSASNVGTMEIDIEELFGFSKENLEYFGYKQLKIDLSYLASRSKYGAPGSVYLANSVSNEAIEYLNPSYSNSDILNSMNTVSSEASATITVNLSDISSNTLYLIFTSLLAMNNQNGSCTYSDIALTLTLVK